MSGPVDSGPVDSGPVDSGRARRQGGFTLMELVVVMGILTGFLVMLLQFVGQGVDLFDEGESGQALADRATSAQQLVERELRALAADGRRTEPGVPDDRLLVQRPALGLPARPRAVDPTGVLLRGGIQLTPLLEERLLEQATILQAALELGPDAELQEIRARAAELQATTPLRGRGRLLLSQWPQTVEGPKDGDQTAALIELRVGRYLVDQRVPVGDELVDPFAVVLPGGPELPALVVYEATEPLVRDLLYFDVRMWSQQTATWDGDGRGPEVVWDSARAGWLADAELGPVFALDRGPASLRDPTDDVHPHALRVTMVVAAEESQRREGLLAEPLAVDGDRLWLVNGERFPGGIDGGFCKVGGEWIRYAERSGDELRGLRRGQRGTAAQAHRSAAIVRVGRTVEFTVTLPHAKDDWNRRDG